ncbi:hypothetical protein FOVG_17340 [Fusarium oxysporum f. sp. pisi HDV247]|uniref:Myb-like domain-containing protein n=1 Tax=Fusarium oxysporum f. sp. pisi HDV247 TaxID=1080344 RepID=W9NF49_FUSOX|nr:hypothetical protein FOVG_17340 [Fusarium oxysporum f. sp. pisi HDV247]
MASSIIDSELLQRFTPPASQSDTACLYNKEAYLACGRSRDTAICIPSDVESDTEDEDDASQLGGSQSYATRTRPPDYLDLTATEHGAPESEAAIGVDIVSSVSPTQAEAAPAWPDEPNVSHLADSEPSQQSSCEINHLLIGDMPASLDVNLATPPTSPESQPYPDGQQLRRAPTSQQSNMMADAVHDHDACHSSQGHPDSPSTGTHSPQTGSPVEVVDTSIQESEIAVGNSCNDPIPEACTPSPARHPPEPHQGQGLDNASCASMLVESDTTEAGSGSETEVSSTSPSPRRFRHKSLQMDKGMQPEDGDAGREGPGSQDGLDGLESQHREQNSPLLPGGAGSTSEDDDFDDDHQCHKRRKVSKSPSCAATSSLSSRQRGPATQAAQLLSGTQTSGHDIDSATPSQGTSALPRAEPFAQFEEWPLRGAVLKRITEGSKTTFQLQFEWDPASCQLHAGRSVSHLKKRKRLPGTLRSASKSSSGRWPPEGNNISSTPDTIHVAEDGVGDGSSDDNLSTSSNFEDNSDSDSDREPRPQTFQRKKTQRRRWTTKDEVLLRQLKHDMLSDCEIATRLKRTESGVKQHWDIMEKARRYREKTKDA